jgi:hypothetical protein
MIIHSPPTHPLLPSPLCRCFHPLFPETFSWTCLSTTATFASRLLFWPSQPTRERVSRVVCFCLFVCLFAPCGDGSDGKHLPQCTPCPLVSLLMHTNECSPASAHTHIFRSAALQHGGMAGSRLGEWGLCSKMTQVGGARWRRCTARLGLSRASQKCSRTSPFSSSTHKRCKTSSAYSSGACEITTSLYRRIQCTVSRPPLIWLAIHASQSTTHNARAY